jgi:hypothetical protein
MDLDQMQIIFCWWLARVSLLLLGLSPLVAAAQVTEAGPNYGTYPITSIPAIGPAGSKVTDPAFGTAVQRLTDGADGSTRCWNQYSYWPVFNKDSTRIAVLCMISGQKRMTLFDFNAATFTASNRRLWSTAGFYEDYLWSAVDPNVFYVRTFATARMLHSYNIATNTTTLVRDFTAELGGGYPVQWSRSIDDDVFAFTHQNSSGSPIGYKVWKRSTNTFLRQYTDSGIDEVQIDKSGRYLVAKAGGNVKVFDLQSGGMTQLYTNSSPWDGFNHSDVGDGTVVALNGPPAWGINYRQLSTPKVFPTTLALTSWNQRNNHYSMLADDEGWALVTNHGPDTPLPSPTVTVAFEHELFQVATDGSGRVRRLVHHNSSDIDYNRQPAANISRDGKFIAWTSDWGNSSGRTDVYIAQIPPASGGSLPPPTGLRVVSP